MEEDKKLEKRKNLEIIILSIIIVVLLGALVYLLFIKKEEPQQPPTPQDNSQIDNNPTNYTVEDVDVSLAYDLLLQSDVGNKNYYSSKLKTISEMSMSEKIGNTIDLVETNDGIVSEQKVKEKYESIYYDNYSAVSNGDTGCNKWTKGTDGNYHVENAGCGSGSISDDVIDYIVSAKKSGDQIEIVAYFYIFDLYSKHTLSDYTNGKLILQDSSINESLEDSEELEKFNVSKYESQFQHYKFVFKLKNNNYTLYSVGPITK